jgi:manganese oxidase
VPVWASFDRGNLFGKVRKAPAQWQVGPILATFGGGLLLGGIVIGLRSFRNFKKRPKEV